MQADTTHVCLIGPMGVGKTTVGRRVADALGRTFDDSDAWIRRTTGRDAATIADDEGVARLHALEADHALTALARTAPSVVALAASAPDDDRVVDALSGHIVVSLTAPAEVLVERLPGAAHRRRLGPDPVTAMEALIRSRAGRVDPTLTVSTTGDPDDAVAAVLAVVGG
ncbi:MAG: shikimate kinase [Acidimicrobiia bacterium]|nr:shikimate kinase [Acidimicrobiia bacterium]